MQGPDSTGEESSIRKTTSGEDGGAVTVEVACQKNAKEIKKMIDEAYAKYIPRLGGRFPAPMRDKIEPMIELRQVFVLKDEGATVGAVRLIRLTDSIMVDNLVVDQTKQGRGYGYRMMDFAEQHARREGVSAITLYTNEAMYENLSFYNRLGFVEVERKTQDGYNRVYLAKTITSVVIKKT
jgi:GNAT superfamily N-acetyltransferase